MRNRSRRQYVAFALVAFVAASVAGLVAHLLSAGSARTRHDLSSNGLALTPPMGFNGWNAYGCHVDASLIEQTAKSMVTSGMRDAGYRYVNIDDCWADRQRASDGSLVANPADFPHGINAVADYVHGLGMKLGIYADAGTHTCAGFPGSFGHEQQDADTFASWGVDYLKYDQCTIPFGKYPGMTHQDVDTALYRKMSKALLSTHRSVVFSMCNGTDPAAKPWLWGPSVANLWRTTPDIKDTFASMKSIVAMNALLARYAKPGSWNDPDTLEIGNGHLTDAESRSEMSLWAEMSAPLIAGTDIPHASAATLKIYVNKAVIAIDQDGLGRQGSLLSAAGGRDVFTKPLANGDVAVALFNSTDARTTISTTARHAGLPTSAGYSLRDLWSAATTHSVGVISASVPAHATVLYRVSVGGRP